MPDSNVQRRQASANRWLVSGVNYRRARGRALTRLANRYKKEYLALLEEEKLKDVALNKKWLDISGSPGDNVDSNTDNIPARETTGEGKGNSK